MKTTFLLSLCFVLVLGVNAQKSKDLFNGKNLKGWKVLNGEAEFKVEDGAIVGVSKTGTPSTWLATKKEYTNFILEYEMVIGKNLNSGVQFRSHFDEEKKHFYGLQVEADDSERAWTCGIYDQGRQGWRYPLEYNPAAKKALKRGQWNKVKVIAYENHIATWLNGINVANLMEEEVETGFIALQIHSAGKDKEGVENKWRNITITELDEEPSFAGATAPVVSYLKNQLTDAEVKDGWKLLWDGKTTKGWRGAKRDDFPEKGWSIKDGILQVHASGGGESEHGGDIVTTRPYKNFILEVDFNFTKGANSGIKYFVDTDLNKGKGSAIGCEFQILDDKNHPDAKKGVGGKRTIGSLYDLIQADSRLFVHGLSPQKYVNTGKWNRARIEVRGSKVKHVLNGCTVVEYERGTQQWKALVAYSKYAQWPNFGEAEEGLILLQDHGDDVLFKNIKIKEL
ncbi:3-keto-disaccharide hydrolase [Saccharicrinis sp. GN24d3]|uniref:3-keto-disaccharide hydrolase n=1 Tax=Saccharicrinis sp. GN24d3 TaxID=3458416 RepID=UPI004036A284